MDHAEQDQELRVRAVALVHGVRVQGRVFPQPLVQAGQRVGPQEGLVLGQHVPLLRVQQEDQTQHEGEQAAVNFVSVPVQRLMEECAFRRAVGRLETAQQLVERVQHLFGQALAHLVLELAAAFQQRGQAPRARLGQQPRLAQQQTHGGADGPTRGLDHLRHPEVEPAGAFAARRGDQPERDAVEEQARGRAGVPQQALHAPVGRDFEAARAHRAVEVLTRLADPNEELPGGRYIGRRTGCGGRRWPVRRRAQILRDLGVRKLRLVTNNPRNLVGLSAYGLEITRSVPFDEPPGTIRRPAAG